MTLFQKILRGVAIPLAVIILSAGIGSVAYAATPTVSTSTYSSSNGDSVPVSISGSNPNSAVYLNYTNSSGSTQSIMIGTTDSNGNLTTNVSSGTNSIPANSSYTVSVGGVTSAQATWPAYTNTNNTNSTSIALGQGSITLTPGQAYSIPISGATGPYTIYSNSNSSIASATISGNSIIGNAASSNGATTVSICQTSNSTICAPLTINVAGTNNTTTSTSTTTPSGIQIMENIPAGQTLTLTLVGATGPFSVSSNSNASIVASNLSSNTLTLSGVSQGQSMVTVCATSGSCLPIYVMVTPATISTGGISIGGSISSTLRIGSRGSDVVTLQQKLIALGLLSSTADGNFGPMTQAAVEQYQTNNGLTSDGIVGPATRASMGL